jgi:DNA-binding MarR family transcriptional regulator
MSDKSSVAPSRQRDRISDETLETSRLLVEFLHAAYATRHQDDAASGRGTATPDGVPAEDPAIGLTDRHSRVPSAVSGHAVRAAIHVYQHGERTVGQIASGLGISYGWASRVVEELEKVGYVVRERDATDRRVVRVRMNPDALEEVERAYHWRGRAVEEAMRPLSDDEREAVRSFLRRLSGLLREGTLDPN